MKLPVARRGLLVLSGVAVVWLVLAAPALAAPANDDFANAEVLPAVPSGEVSALLFEASKEPGEPNHAGNVGGHSVWYSWTPARNGEASIAPGCSNGSATLIGVYTGASVDSLTEVASNEHAKPPNCFGDDDETIFTVEAGTTYWIAVDGRDGSQGFQTLLLRAAPANDDFADATVVPAEPPPYISGFNRYAGAEAGEPLHAGEPGGHSLWYSWTPTASGPVVISTCSSFSQIDALLAVYAGSDLGSLTPLAANDDAPPPVGYPACRGLDSEVSIDAVAGTTYRIAVDGANGTVGSFTLRIAGPPTNDGFAAPTVLAASPFGSLQGTNRLATTQAGEPDHGGDGGGASVWFSWTPDSSGPVQIVTCNENYESSYEPLLGVYTGTAVGALTPVATTDESDSQVCLAAAAASFDAVAGTTYRIAVDGKGGSQGRYTLDLKRPPANDSFAQAKTLSAGFPSFGDSTTRLASKEPGEPNHAGDPGGHSVWFTWTPASSQRVVVTSCAYTEYGPETLLGIYTGTSVAGLTPVASEEESTDCGRLGSAASFDAVAGTTYRIAVDGKDGSPQGNFGVGITARPANDDFGAAEALPGEPTSAGGSTVLSTKQPGEPSHAGDPGGHSVWYSWTPTESGPVAITACGRNEQIDTLLAVYTGAALNALTPVAANDDVTGKPGNEFCEWTTGTSEVEFDAVAGTTYRIAVDGKGGTAGGFGVQFERAPDNDDFTDARALSVEMPAYGSATIRRASKQPGEPNHAGIPGGHSVWFTWTAPSSGSFAVSTCTYGKDLDAVLAVYTGSSLGALTTVASNDDDGSDCRATDAEAQFSAVAGTTYRIAVDGKDGARGTVHVELQGVAANDSFSKPEPLASGAPNQTWSSSRFAGKQDGEPNHAGAAGGASVWFKWTAARSGKVSIDTCASRFDTLLAVYKGPAVSSLDPIASNDDGAGSCGPQSRVNFDAVANTVYKIAVDGKGGAQGAIRLQIDEPSGNDDFAAAERIDDGFGWFWPASSVLSTKQPGEPNHAGDPGGHSVWFTWTPTATGAVEIDACSETFEPLVAIYTGSALDALTPVPSAPAGLGECEEGSSTRFDAVAGTIYRIAVDGDEGRFELQLRKGGAHAPTLSVQKTGTGTGSVSSTPAGIACGPVCSQAFAGGTVVTLTAVPAGGSTFLGWSGGGCSGTGTCQLTLNADATVVANFQVPAAGGGGDGSSGGGGGAPVLKPQPKPKPLKCKPGFKKVKVKGKQKCVKKKKPGKGKGKSGGKNKGRAQKS